VALPPWLVQSQEWAKAAYEILKPIGIVVAGWWTYRRFIADRPRIARAKIDATVTVLEESSAYTIVRANVSLTNTGPVRIVLREGRVELQRIRPLPSGIQAALSNGTAPEAETGHFPWTTAARPSNPHAVTHRHPFGQGKHAYVDVECGQTEELAFDFCVPSEIERCFLYAHFQNTTKSRRRLLWNRGPEIGWASTTAWEFVTANGRKRVIRMNDATAPSYGTKIDAESEDRMTKKQAIETVPNERLVPRDRKDQRLRPSLPEQLPPTVIPQPSTPATSPSEPKK